MSSPSLSTNVRVLEWNCLPMSGKNKNSSYSQELVIKIALKILKLDEEGVAFHVENDPDPSQAGQFPNEKYYFDFGQYNRIFERCSGRAYVTEEFLDVLNQAAEKEGILLECPRGDAKSREHAPRPNSKVDVICLQATPSAVVEAFRNLYFAEMYKK